MGDAKSYQNKTGIMLLNSGVKASVGLAVSVVPCIVLLRGRGMRLFSMGIGAGFGAGYGVHQADAHLRFPSQFPLPETPEEHLEQWRDCVMSRIPKM
mmetsp:Transcript_30688/g.69847  ORF Transcript_30688/g.69847 Transcript_30688/m.69847 type:complete len:97 (-) Transcript_30688:142-432(-)